MMKKIIIQIYNNLQFLWSSKANLFHCLSCWDAPSLGPILVFSEFQVLLSHLWGLKKIKIKIKEDRRKKRYKRRERRSRTRKQEREEEGVKRKKSNNKIIIKNYFKMGEKKKNQACSLQTVHDSFAGVFGCSQPRGPSPALLPSRLAFGQPLAQFSSGPWTHKFRHSPSSWIWVQERGLQ